ncbi:MAG: hypothetical protein JJU21_11865 [Salinarimonas sp.]|nr:hypothetical protein [Salinarimonas sp.]
MITGRQCRAGVFALVLGFAAVPMALDADARSGREPQACMFLALEYAEELVANERIEALYDEQVGILATFEGLMDDETRPPDVRLDEARTMLRSREMRDLDREIRRSIRTLDEGRSIVAGWRGQYCPVARPDGGAGLSGQDRCDALSANFVDQIRIDRRSPEQTRLREALETERQTILKARVTRSERNDLLELLRLRTEAVETLDRLERFITLRDEAHGLIAGVEDEGCVEAERS